MDSEMHFSHKEEQVLSNACEQVTSDDISYSLSLKMFYGASLFTVKKAMREWFKLYLNIPGFS